MITHRETRLLPYSAEQMFDLVVAVDHYPEFLPWCIGARIRRQEETELWADLIIGFKMFRESFTSHVRIHRPRAVEVGFVEGPFKRLVNQWRFEPQAGGGCRVDFYVEFEFRSRVLQAAIGALFHEATRRMIAAFEARAKQLYGEAARLPEPKV